MADDITKPNRVRRQRVIYTRPSDLGPENDTGNSLQRATDEGGVRCPYCGRSFFDLMMHYAQVPACGKEYHAELQERFS